jgi:hypothetical protein
MSDTNTTTLSELIQAIQLSLQPYRSSNSSENPFSELSTMYDGAVDVQASKPIVDRSRRDSGISVSSNTSPVLRTGEFSIARGRGFSDLGTSPFSRRSSQLHQLDTKGSILPYQITQSPNRSRYEFPSQFSISSPLSGIHSVDQKSASREERPTATSLSKILRERQLRSSPSILTTPQFSARKGCILAPNCSIEATRFQAITESGLPAWWCRYDNLVVFDGMGPEDATGQQLPKTRSAKGLGIANRLGKEEVVIVKLDCTHCREALGLRVWKYTSRVCQRSVCAVCKARCKAEWHRSLGMLDSKEADVPPPFSSQHVDTEISHPPETSNGDSTASTIEPLPTASIETPAITPIPAITTNPEPDDKG